MRMIFRTHKVILTNILWLILEKGLTIALVFVSEGVTSQILGIEQYGKWIYSVNFILLLSSLALMAGSEVIIPALSKNRIISDEIMTSGFLIRFFAAIFAFVFTQCYISFFIQDNDISYFLSILAFVLLLNEPFGIVANYFQSIVKIKWVVIARLIGIFVRTGFLVLILYLIHDKYYIPFSRVLESLFVVIFFLFLYFKVALRKFVFNKKVFYVILLRGIKIWMPLLLMYLFLRLD